MCGFRGFESRLLGLGVSGLGFGGCFTSELMGLSIHVNPCVFGLRAWVSSSKAKALRIQI